MDLEDDPPARRRPRQDSQDSLATPETELDGQYTLGGSLARTVGSPELLLVHLKVKPNEYLRILQRQ